MLDFSELDVRTPEETLQAMYCLAYTDARDRLQEGLHREAVRFTQHLAGERQPAPRPRVAEAKWRGLEGALAGRG